MTTQTGSTLWLPLVGGHRRVAVFMSKAEVVGNLSSVVLRKNNGELRNCITAALLRVSLGVDIGQLYLVA